MIVIKRVLTDDIDALVAISQKTFFDAFLHLNNPDDMEAHAGSALSADKLLSEINNTNSAFYFALLDDVVVGYIKINYSTAQTEFQDAESAEVQRIYVSAEQQGKQIGKQLLDFATALGNEQHLKFIWLGVWEHNHNAIRFYENNGFKLFGSHDFMLGSDKQTDLLLRKEL